MLNRYKVAIRHEIYRFLKFLPIKNGMKNAPGDSKELGKILFFVQHPQQIEDLFFCNISASQ